MNTAITKIQIKTQERTKADQSDGSQNIQGTAIAPALLLEAQTLTLKKTKPAPVWLSLYFSQIALISAQAGRDNKHDCIERPLIVVEMQQNQSRVYRANDQAGAQGIEKGCLLNAAYILCRDLEVVTRDQTIELQQLKKYTQRVTRFTPQIVLSGTDTILLEVRRSLRLFGGLAALLTQLNQVFPDVLLHIACAPVPLAAELMARNGIQKLISHRKHLQSTLGNILLHQTTVSPALVHKLERCGLACLRDVWRLPRVGLARRFGPDLLQYLDQLNGSIESPQTIFKAENCFSAGHDFDQETETTSLLLHAAGLLLQQAQQFLQVRALLCEKVNFRFVYTHHRGELRQGHQMSVYAQQGGDTAAHFLSQLEVHLQHFVFKKAVLRIELHIDQFRLRQDSTMDLFRRSRENPQSWPMLLDILIARLGEKSIYYLLSREDHRPEKSWHKRYTNKQAEIVTQALALSRPHSLPSRPAWLLPLPLKVARTTFTLVSGAERLESGWWSGKDLRREYYQGISSSGQHCWLFRDIKARQAQWYLHGLFA